MLNQNHYHLQYVYVLFYYYADLLVYVFEAVCQINHSVLTNSHFWNKQSRYTRDFQLAHK